MTVRGSAVPESVRQLLQGHLDFLTSAGQLTVRDMMGPLREYAQVYLHVLRLTVPSTSLLWHFPIIRDNVMASSNSASVCLQHLV